MNPMKSRAKLSPNEVLMIFELKTTSSATKVCKLFAVSEKAVRDIWTGRTWTNVTCDSMQKKDMKRDVQDECLTIKKVDHRKQNSGATFDVEPLRPPTQLPQQSSINQSKSLPEPLPGHNRQQKNANIMHEEYPTQVSKFKMSKRFHLDDVLSDWEHSMPNHPCCPDPFHEDWAGKSGEG
jgi:hypothetical protein